MRSGLVGLIALLLVTRIAVAQAPQRALVLEVDRCPHTEAKDAELSRQGEERYKRALTLYQQGDYKAAVSEFVASYCKISSYGWSLLKDIGQAYERDLNYEMAVAYFERYVNDIPADAKRRDSCSVDPQQDREWMRGRVGVLKDLKAHVLIQTVPGGARITIQRKDGVLVRHGNSGDTFELVAGDYVIRTDLRGSVATTKRISPKIGKPENHLIPLPAQTGTLAVQVTPADAKIYLVDGLVDRFVGIGKYEAQLDVRKYVVRAEKSGRIELGKEVEVKADQVTQVPLELVPQRQLGRRQLIGFATAASTFAAGGLLNAFGNTGIASLGALGGGAAGATFTYLYLPHNLDLGTSNLTITSTLAGAVVGGAGALVFSGNDNVIGPAIGATMAIGGAAGYYFGDATKVRPGDAALIGTAMGWGTFAGFMFAESFGPGRQAYAGLVLSGFGMGAVSGGLMTRYFDISRTHAVLIDVGGVIGVLGGLALEGLIYGGASGASGMGDRFDDAQREHIANFSLGGMAVGLITAGILTRNMDAPKIPMTPTIGTAVGPGGKTTATYGFGGVF